MINEGGRLRAGAGTKHQPWFLLCTPCQQRLGLRCVDTGWIALQVNQQLLDTEQDYDRLKNTPLVTSLGITLEDLMWATDIVNSRSFAIPKALGASLHSVLAKCYPRLLFCIILQRSKNILITYNVNIYTMVWHAADISSAWVLLQVWSLQCTV